MKDSAIRQSKKQEVDKELTVKFILMLAEQKLDGNMLVFLPGIKIMQEIEAELKPNLMHTSICKIVLLHSSVEV